jgi:pantothenate kinase
MNEIYHRLAQRAVQAFAKLESDSGSPRLLIALAGSPGAGKTTTAQAVADIVNATLLPSPNPPSMVVVSMDGFHYPRSVLDKMPNPKEAHEKRGAPFTFDAEACVKFVKGLRSNGEELRAPSFDHAVKDPVDGGTIIPARARIVLIEGNYVLSDEQPWKQISDFVDEKWFIDVKVQLARERVAARHVASGITPDREGALWRVDNIDIPNGEYIKNHLVPPDVRVESINEPLVA